MKRAYLVLIIIFMFACGNIEFKSYYPAYPPENIDLILLTAANHDGSYTNDYLLLFRSENRKNTRFGGFLVFINSTAESLLEMKTKEEASYKLGRLAIPEEDPSIYNPTDSTTGGINAQLAILFTNNSNAKPGDTITVNSINYTLTGVRSNDSAILIPGYWLTMRAYLWDSINNIILEVGNPGNVVQIP